MNDDVPATPAGDRAAPDPANPPGEPAVTPPVETPDGDGSTPADVQQAGDGQAEIENEVDAVAGADVADGTVAIQAPGGPAGRMAALRSVNPARVGRYLGAALAGALLTAVLFMAFGSTGTPAASPSPPATAEPTPAATETAATAAPSGAAGGSIPAEGSTLGSPDAPVTIEIWSDFQCPYCSLFAHAIESDLIRGPVAGGEVQLAYSDFVFLGQESLDAAVAARCAGQQGEFWRYHDLLYAFQNPSGENQGTFNQQFLVEAAKYAGLDAAQFTTCLADQSIAVAIAAQKQVGDSAGVTSTPTLIIRGPAATRMVRGLPSWPSLMLEIDRAMGRAPIPSPAPTEAAATSEASPGSSGTPTEPAPSAAAAESASPGATTVP